MPPSRTVAFTVGRCSPFPQPVFLNVVMPAREISIWIRTTFVPAKMSSPAVEGPSVDGSELAEAKLTPIEPALTQQNKRTAIRGRMALLCIGQFQS